MRKNIISFYLLFAVVLVLSSSSYARKRSIKDIFKELSSIREPFKLRDPFKSPFERKKISFMEKKKENLVRSAEEILRSVNVEDIRVVGILVGKERRAVLKIRGLEGRGTLLAKEGMIIGEDGAELKAILPGGIVLVEKIRNIYDDDEYIETIIPLSIN